MSHAQYSLFLLSLLGAWSSTSARIHAEAYTESVLKPGMSVTATNANGTVTIEAGQGTVRRYSGEGWENEVILLARTQRWYGSLGLYNPGSGKRNDTVVITDEGRLFFDSVDAALRGIMPSSARMKFVYTSDGLVFGFNEQIAPQGGARRSVQLFQIYITGEKPAGLPGARDDLFKIEGGTTLSRAEPHDAPVGLKRPTAMEPYDPSVYPVPDRNASNE
ncbi:MAG: hypothetical protein ACFB21_01345 [Opitutales bacterium]